MVHQHFMLQDSMTVLENVVLFAPNPLRGAGLVDFFFRPAQGSEAIAAEYGIGMQLNAQGRGAVGLRKGRWS